MSSSSSSSSSSSPSLSLCSSLPSIDVYSFDPFSDDTLPSASPPLSPTAHKRALRGRGGGPKGKERGKEREREREEDKERDKGKQRALRLIDGNIPLPAGPANKSSQYVHKNRINPPRQTNAFLLKIDEEASIATQPIRVRDSNALNGSLPLSLNDSIQLSPAFDEESPALCAPSSAGEGPSSALMASYTSLNDSLDSILNDSRSLCLSPGREREGPLASIEHIDEWEALNRSAELVGGTDVPFASSAASTSLSSSASSLLHRVLVKSGRLPPSSVPPSLSSSSSLHAPSSVSSSPQIESSSLTMLSSRVNFLDHGMATILSSRAAAHRYIEMIRRRLLEYIALNKDLAKSHAQEQMKNKAVMRSKKIMNNRLQQLEKYYKAANELNKANEEKEKEKEKESKDKRSGGKGRAAANVLVETIADNRKISALESEISALKKEVQNAAAENERVREEKKRGEIAAEQQREEIQALTAELQEANDLYKEKCKENKELQAKLKNLQKGQEERLSGGKKNVNAEERALRQQSEYEEQIKAMEEEALLLKSQYKSAQKSLNEEIRNKNNSLAEQRELMKQAEQLRKEKSTVSERLESVKYELMESIKREEYVEKQLQLQIDQTGTEKQAKEEEIERRKELEKELREKKRELKAITDKQNEMTTLLEKKEEKINELSLSMQESDAGVTLANKEISIFRAEKEKLAAQLETRERELTERDEEIKKKQKEMEEKTSAMAAMEGSLSSLKESFKSHEGQLNQLSEERMNAEEGYEMALFDASKQREIAEIRAKSYEFEVSVLEEEKKALEAAYNKSCQRVDELVDTVNQLTGELEGIHNELQEIEKQHLQQTERMKERAAKAGGMQYTTPINPSSRVINSKGIGTAAVVEKKSSLSSSRWRAAVKEIIGENEDEDENVFDFPGMNKGSAATAPQKKGSSFLPGGKGKNSGGAKHNNKNEAIESKRSFDPFSPSHNDSGRSSSSSSTACVASSSSSSSSSSAPSLEATAFSSNDSAPSYPSSADDRMAALEARMNDLLSLKPIRLLEKFNTAYLMEVSTIQQKPPASSSSSHPSSPAPCLSSLSDDSKDSFSMDSFAFTSDPRRLSAELGRMVDQTFGGGDISIIQSNTFDESL